MLKKLLLLLTATLILLTGCTKNQEPPIDLATDDPLPADAVQPDTTEYAYCGNTETTVLYEGKEYTFMGSPSVNLTDLLRRLSYDPEKVCKCADYDLTVTTEFGGPYYISLNERYARCHTEQGFLAQADLTEEQLQTIQTILQNLK